MCFATGKWTLCTNPCIKHRITFITFIAEHSILTDFSNENFAGNFIKAYTLAVFEDSLEERRAVFDDSLKHGRAGP